MESFGIKKSGVRHDAAHSLRTDRALGYGVAEQRHWVCTCGRDFGRQFDSVITGIYRAHRVEEMAR